MKSRFAGLCLLCFVCVVGLMIMATFRRKLMTRMMQFLLTLTASCFWVGSMMIAAMAQEPPVQSKGQKAVDLCRPDRRDRRRSRPAAARTPDHSRAGRRCCRAASSGPADDHARARGQRAFTPRRQARPNFACR